MAERGHEAPLVALSGAGEAWPAPCSPQPMSSFSASPCHPFPTPTFLLLLHHPSNVLALLFLQSKQHCWKNNLQEAG